MHGCCRCAGWGSWRSAASAEAPVPWWHLTSGSRPSVLPVAGTAVDDVQEITISATSGDFYVEDPATGKNDLESPLSYDATAAPVREVLEKYIYPGRVLSVEENQRKGYVGNPHIHRDVSRTSGGCYEREIVLPFGAEGR